MFAGITSVGPGVRLAPDVGGAEPLVPDIPVDCVPEEFVHPAKAAIAQRQIRTEMIMFVFIIPEHEGERYLMVAIFKFQWLFFISCG
jgi:hypothetical protein